MKLTLLCLVFLQTVFYGFCILFGKNSLEDEDTRFMVSLQAEDPYNKHFCSGVFITTKFVLTAASCVKNRQTEDFWIVAGVRQLSDSKEQLVLKADKIFSKDPSGHNNVRNNIALLRIATIIPDSDCKKVSTVKLASDGENIDDDEGKSCKTYGWGAIKNANEAADNLQVGTKEITHWKNCRQPYKVGADEYNMPKDITCRRITPLSYNNDVDESNICTSCADKAQLCYFDAGDPLMSEHRLLGMATENYLCDTSNNNDVYTRIDSHKDWIREIIEPTDSSSTNISLSVGSSSGGSSLVSFLSRRLIIMTETGIIVLLIRPGL